MKTKIIMIVSISKNGLIAGMGKGYLTPWPMRNDEESFKETVNGKLVVADEQVWRLLTHRKLLKNCKSLVLSLGKRTHLPQSVPVAKSVEEVISYAEKISQDIVVVGGIEVYRAFMPLVSKVCISWICGPVECGTDPVYFDEGLFNFIGEYFDKIFDDVMERDEQNPYPIAYSIYKRIN